MKHKWILPVTAAITLLAILCMIFILFMGSASNEKAAFTPPPFESTAISGTPSVDTKLGWSQIAQDGMGFSVHICGNVIVKDDSADIYFTNNEENTIWMKLRILSETGEILGETGILKPNEYVKSVKFTTVPKNGEKIKLKIMAYQPKTYYSEGSVSLNTAVTVGG